MLIDNNLTVNEVTVFSVKKYKIYFKTVTDKMSDGGSFMGNMPNRTKIGQYGRKSSAMIL